MQEENRLKLSQLRDYIDQVIGQAGDLDVSITLPGWMVGAEDPDSTQHSWNFGIYILDMIDKAEDGTETRERIASLGHLGDFELNKRKKHLHLVEDDD